jgi:small conductance mechanosensitive channel
MADEATKIKAEVAEKVGVLEDYSNKLLHWAENFFPHLIISIIVLIIGFWLIRRVVHLADKGMQKRGMEVSLRTFLESLIRIGLKTVLIIFVAELLGFQTASFVTILGAAGLAIGLALQGSLSNFSGGVLILVFKPYKVGDTIETMGQQGQVTEIQIFNTILLTLEHKTVILPNGAVSNASIINHTRHGDLRIDIDLNISDKHEIAWIRQLILEEITKDQRILNTPAPSVGFLKFIENGYSIGIRMYSTLGDRVSVTADCIERIQALFVKHAVEVPKHHSYIHTVV